MLFSYYTYNVEDDHWYSIIINLVYWKSLFNPITHGIYTLQVPQGVDSTNPLENPLMVVCVQFFKNPVKLLYNCRSHGKGESQEFKIEEIEEFWNSNWKSCQKFVAKEKCITQSNLKLLNYENCEMELIIQIYTTN